jgi:hypothetical protein
MEGASALLPSLVSLLAILALPKPDGLSQKLSGDFDDKILLSCICLARVATEYVPVSHKIDHSGYSYFIYGYLYHYYVYATTA